MERPQKIVSLQGMRAVAALAIAFSHFHHQYVQKPGDTTFGVLGFGVDIFFVISGFIMMHLSFDKFGSLANSADFLIRRLIRIVPLYWFCTCIYAAYLYRIQTFEVARVTWEHLCLSLLFYPHVSPIGSTYPFLNVGWTLNYEMFFYLCFAAALLAPRRVGVALLICGFVALAYFARRGLPMPWAFLGNPIIFAFLLGVGLAVANRHLPRISLPLCLAIIAAAGTLAAAAYFSPSFTGDSRVYTWGPCAAAAVAAAMLYEGKLPGWVETTMVVLGDSSYAIYLIHTVLLFIGLYAVAWLHAYHQIVIPTQNWWFLSFMMALTITLSIAIHYLLDLPVQRGLLALFRRKNRDAVEAGRAVAAVPGTTTESA
ncbi:hypothetical protein DB346_19045 [Verrucomicrobia bacterium LW23]|nr:hypothetical protein DB346_19045 [Verrucomicrobia bacterium LW23]